MTNDKCAQRPRSRAALRSFAPPRSPTVELFVPPGCLPLREAPPGALRILARYPRRLAFGAASPSGLIGASTFRAVPESSSKTRPATSPSVTIDAAIFIRLTSALAVCQTADSKRFYSFCSRVKPRILVRTRSGMHGTMSRQSIGGRNYRLRVVTVEPTAQDNCWGVRLHGARHREGERAQGDGSV